MYVGSVYPISMIHVKKCTWICYICFKRKFTVTKKIVPWWGTAHWHRLYIYQRSYKCLGPHYYPLRKTKSRNQLIGKISPGPPGLFTNYGYMLILHFIVITICLQMDNTDEKLFFRVGVLFHGGYKRMA